MFLVGFIMVLDPASNSEYVAIGQRLVIIGWAGFLVDYVIGIALSPDRFRYVRSHVAQAVGVLVPPLHILLLGKVARTMTTGARRKFGGRVRVYALYLTTLLIVFSAVVVTFFERADPAANITSLGDSLWWTTETVSTVGYGDFYPVTLGGRIVAVVLFINGIALLSVVTATIAAKVLDYDDESGKETDINLAELYRKLTEIERKIDLREADESVVGTGSNGDERDAETDGTRTTNT
jgi:voltage-gated potassium channel